MDQPNRSLHRQRWLTTLTALATTLISTTAAAEEAIDRWYVSIYGGTSVLGKQDTRLSRTGQPDSTGDISTRAGWLAGGAIGLRVRPELRVELEMTYRTNELKSVDVLGLDGRPTDGDYASLMYMVNGYYDFAQWNASFATFRPYVGVGVGYAQEIDTDQSINGAPVEFSGSKAAYQLLAGVNWHYQSRLTAGLGIRYTGASTVELESNRSGTGPLRAKYEGLGVVASLGYRF
jgi:opacity protein-like surface antigen